MQKINAVIYARFSSHKQNEESIEQQVAECKKYADDNGYTIIDVYADEAISARSDVRPNFQRLIRDAEHAHNFQTVIAYKSNRISRNMLQALEYENRFSAAGVNIVYVKEFFGDNAAGRFALRSMMNLNQFYSENMAEDIKRAMIANAQECKVNARPRFGYAKGPDGKYIINEDTAAIVREIFDKACKGITINDIRDSLNDRQIKTSYGRSFRTQTIENILKNEMYKGIYKWSDIVIPGGVPAIVSEEVWTMAQNSARIRKRQPSDKWKQKENYLLTGKLFCGHCESQMTGRSANNTYGKRYAYYECFGAARSSCDKKPVAKDKIEQAVIHYLVTEVLTDEVMHDIAYETEHQIRAYYDESNVEKKAAEKQLKSNERKMRRYLDLIGDGKFVDSMLVEMRAIEEENAKLQNLITEYSSVNIDFNPEDLIEFMKGLRVLADKPFFERQMIDVFVNAIYLYDDYFDIVINLGPNNNRQRISLKKASECIERSGEKVRGRNTMGYQYVPTRTFYGIRRVNIM